MGGHSTIELLCLTSTKQYLSASAVGGHRVISTSAPSPGRKAHAGWKNYFGFALFFFTQLFSGQEKSL
jgi:hypothetical protein